MAFLCPVRIKSRSKKKKGNSDLELSNSGLGLNHGIGRITGSASIETLVRVGIEKEHGLSPDSKMVVLHDFVRHTKYLFLSLAPDHLAFLPVPLCRRRTGGETGSNRQHFVSRK